MIVIVIVIVTPTASGIVIVDRPAAGNREPDCVGIW
jgi:hypothetical protein